MNPIDLSALRCLVVDDNSHMRRIVRMLLHGYGIREVIEAEDGASGLEMFQTNVPDFVIVDWAMPIFNGLELTRMLRSTESSINPYVPIIMITGHSDKKRVVEARDAGITEFVCKPLSAKALYQRIVLSVVSPRPFIKTKTFFGPDRRRYTGLNNYSGEERRSGKNTDAQFTQIDSLIQDQLEKTSA